ncbi:LIP-domain-containing protein [Hypoxylon trugodes]|uniref:LIP-domain-containing protein n=1 Tax=Hypoxylon trugodes TaxID=326681 RepID=UPI0021914AC8|nr:LIP-domain-containing protein [Hypoxylon trugodes]KAI1394351.1 LIP-domain-containing protein [Hypoxylon trugodes]
MRSLIWMAGVCAASQQLLPQAPGNTTTPLRPSQDPWYTTPAGFETAEPGEILRIRSAPGNLTSIIGNATTAYNILYRTTDSRYQPSWAVTTLIIPNVTYVSPSGSKALLSYQFAYDSAAIDASPSYGLYNELSQAFPTLGIPASTDLVAELLGQGWIINTPDYEGFNASFGCTIQSGHATLDSVRAVLNLARLTDFGNVTAAIWGYSGGSLATEAAAELQVQYAPNLAIAGAVVGGLPADLPADLHLFNKSPLSGDLVALLVGLTTQYPDADAYLQSRLHPENASEFYNAKTMVTGEGINFFSMKDIYDYFIGGVEDLQAPVLQKVFDTEGKLGYHGVPTVPMFFYKAIGDEYCPVNETDAVVNKYCGVGADITYDRNTVGGHVAEITNGQDRAINWLWSVFNESYVSHTLGCTIRNVTVNITSSPS